MAAMGCMREGSLARSARDVTCWEHPAKEHTGAVITINSVMRAAAARVARCRERKTVFILQEAETVPAGLTDPPISGSAWGPESLRRRFHLRAGAGRGRNTSVCLLLLIAIVVEKHVFAL
jgi:hypothetical protein